MTLIPVSWSNGCFQIKFLQCQSVQKFLYQKYTSVGTANEFSELAFSSVVCCTGDRFFDLIMSAILRRIFKLKFPRPALTQHFFFLQARGSGAKLSLPAYMDRINRKLAEAGLVIVDARMGMFITTRGHWQFSVLITIVAFLKKEKVPFCLIRFARQLKSPSDYCLLWHALARSHVLLELHRTD